MSPQPCTLFLLEGVCVPRVADHVDGVLVVRGLPSVYLEDRDLGPVRNAHWEEHLAAFKRVAG
jgi:hypothetical protein